MPDEPLSAQPGWYPTPDGRQRYWNGSTWLDLPEPSGPSAPTSVKTPRWRPSKKLVIIAAAALLVLAVGGITAKIFHDSNVKAEQQVAQDAADQAAQQESDRVAAAAAAQKKADDSERVSRLISVSGIESSIKKMAEDHISKGIVDGPIISVSCSPVSGGSADDLTATTTVFECFVSNEDNGDGTMSGYKYHSTMNWTTGSYTYGFGAP
ncbi:DUF2510 domain-containing protein [Rhodococcus sp. 1168]|uniref:DUF2510 domain-containing protein n=1 Tax=Rhodococcus sp. 1168 TaxID=2018041 RepID=UPI000A09F752|nr:DUF2510 domain-containing protein [Rhodococcus sp. 1168]ORI21180.1 hypothetical protein BJI47_17225 [Rhodococcus sp. 1168]